MGFCCGGLGWGLGGWGSLGILGFILNAVLFIGLLVLLVFGARWVVRQFAPRGDVGSARGDALEIARRRLAAGEISIQEFEEIRARIGG